LDQVVEYTAEITKRKLEEHKFKQIKEKDEKFEELKKANDQGFKEFCEALDSELQ
jgi:hypothetical protein